MSGTSAIIKHTGYAYELRSVNLTNLVDKEALAVLDTFNAFLNTLAEPTAFHIISDVRTVTAGGSSFPIAYKRFFVESASQIDDQLAMLRTPVVRVPSVPTVPIRSELPSYLVNENSEFVKAFSVTQLAPNLPAGFLAQLYPLTSWIRVEILPVEFWKAKRKTESRFKSIGASIILKEREGKYVDPAERYERDMVQEAANQVAVGRQRLFKVRVMLAINAGTYKELEAGTTDLYKQATVLGQLDSPKYIQKALLSGKGPSWVTGRWFYVNTALLTRFIPFSGLDIIDPEGILVGENRQTGNAIIYDLYEKENYNVCVIGQTGYGKSVLIKCWLERMAKKYPDISIVIFDSIVKPEYALGPDGTLESSVAALTGCAPYRFSAFTEREGRGAGLDPFNVFENKRLAANFIASAAKIENEPDLLADLYIEADKSSNVEELIGRAPQELGKRLRANLQVYKPLFEGEMELRDKMCFVLYDIPDRELRDAAAFLSLSAVWKMIREKMEVKRRKIIVVDEGWALVEVNPRTGKSYFPMAVEYVPELVRTGRHYNAAFVIATQLASDFLGRGESKGPGRAVVESCATKWLLKQDQAAADEIRKAFNLSDDEEREILNARPGQGIMITQDGHIPFYNRLTDLEEALFTTTPKEMKT